MKVILRLLGFLRPASRQVLLSILAGLATIGSGIGMLGTSAYLIANAALHPSIAELQVAIVGVRFFGISRGVFRYLERLISHSVNLKLLSEIRVWFYRQVEPLAPAGLQAFSSGDLLQRSVGDIEILENFYVRVISPVIVALITSAGVSWFVGITYPTLSWILASGLLVNGFVLPVITYTLNRKNSKELIDRQSDYSSEVVEYIQGLGELQLFDAKKEYRTRLIASADRFSRLHLRNSLANGLNNGLSLVFTNLTVAASLWILIPVVSRGEIPGTSLAVIAMIILASFEAVTPLPMAAQQIGASYEAAKRLFAIADMDRDHLPAETGKLPDHPAEELKIAHLQFRYPGDDPFMLDDLSLELHPGKKIGMVGPSGSGKSSLVNLLLRYWDYQQGEIKLDSNDLKSLDPEYTREQFGVVVQKPFLFNASLRENLRMAAPECNDEEMVHALQQVSLGSWLNDLPSGLDTWLGENGLQMSGGEKQRVAVAQVILRNPAFILLDEPTANLDPITSHQMINQLLDLFGGKGVLLITHDLTNLKRMDEIIVIENGMVIERGNYPSLVAVGGRFAALAAIQQDLVGVG